jgi:hypothetical protein
MSDIVERLRRCQDSWALLREAADEIERLRTDPAPVLRQLSEMEGQLNESMYVIWSNEHRGWWRIGRNGYTRNLREAGHYMRDEALAICREAIMTAAHIGMISELPVRLGDVEDFLQGQHVPAAIRQERQP